MLIFHKDHNNTIQVYSVSVMTHVKELYAGQSSQGTSEPITPAPTPTPPPRTVITALETLLQRLLPGTPVSVLRTRPGPARRDWATIIYFSYGKLGHGVGRCPELNETFPYMLLGWSAEKVGDNYMMISPRVAAERHCAGNGD